METCSFGDEKMELINNGGFGCVFIKEGEEGQTSSPRYVTKIMEDRSGNYEIENGKKIIKNPFYRDFFAPVEESCRVDFGETPLTNDGFSLMANTNSIEKYNKDVIQECPVIQKNIDSLSINPRQYLSVKIPYIEGINNNEKELDDYLLIHPSEFFHLYDSLFYGYSLLNEKVGILHYDIKANNVLIEKMTREPIIIDFGLSFDTDLFNNWKDNIDDLQKKFNFYGPQYRNIDIMIFIKCLETWMSSLPPSSATSAPINPTPSLFGAPSTNPNPTTPPTSATTSLFGATPNTNPSPTNTNPSPTNTNPSPTNTSPTNTSPTNTNPSPSPTNPSPTNPSPTTNPSFFGAIFGSTINSNEKTSGMKIIDDTIDEFFNPERKHYFYNEIFTQSEIDTYKNECKEYYKKFEKIEDIMEDTLKYYPTWDNYGLAVCMIYILDNIKDTMENTEYEKIQKFLKDIIFASLGNRPTLQESHHEFIELVEYSYR
jgi:hypothetical protein